jgi:two-component system cell cycle response regulator DivK
MKKFPRSRERLFELILLAAPSIELADVLQITLGCLGYRVVIVRDGIDLVGAAISLGPDLIVMDVSMPEIDGFQVASVLRRNPATKSIPIMATSAMISPETKEKCLASGCNDYLPKPFTAKELVDAIERLLRENRSPNNRTEGKSKPSEQEAVLTHEQQVKNRTYRPLT